MEGSLPRPVCYCALEIHSGRKIQFWEDELRELKTCPIDLGPDVLFVSYNAPAEFLVHVVLGWDLPYCVLDLYVEFNHLVASLPKGQQPSRGLLDCLEYFGLPTRAHQCKHDMYQLILQRIPGDDTHKDEILAYCFEDVEDLQTLLPRMLPHFDLKHGVYRGRYTCAIARVMHVGIPLDIENLTRISRNWGRIKFEVIKRHPVARELYDGLTFKQDRLEGWVREQGYRWPKTATGRLSTSEDTWEAMSNLYPEVRSLAQVIKTVNKLRTIDLQAGDDGRCRPSLFPMKTLTGRNAPSSTRFPFNLTPWLRSLVQPATGMALIEADYMAQEFAVMATLSGDENMQWAYRTGDPYLATAIMAGDAPKGATKQTHGQIRNIYKLVCLGLQYGMQLRTLSAYIGQPIYVAKRLRDRHRRVYAQFWGWIRRVRTAAYYQGHMQTEFGWRLRVMPHVKPTTLLNFPGQANAAEMTRLAMCLATERGLKVIASVHDSLIVECPIADVKDVQTKLENTMTEASRLVLRGFENRVESVVYAYPDRFMKTGGEQMWGLVQQILADDPGT